MFQSITLAARARTAPETVVVGVFGDKQSVAPLDDRTKAALNGLGLLPAVQAALGRREATGEVGAVLEAFPNAPIAGPGAKASGKDAAPVTGRVLIVGLGPLADFEPNILRVAAAAAGRRLAAAKARSVHAEMDGPVLAAKADLSHAGSAFGEGLGLLGWSCDTFRGKATPDPKRSKLELRAGDGDFAAGVERGLALADSANYCRTLSQTPPNVATPLWMAAEAQKLGKRVGLSVRIIQGDDLSRERMEGLINVGKASENKPCLIRLEYTPGGARGTAKGKGSAGGRRSAKPLVLVGKTVTYDTGGLSLKVNNGMVGMKRDKDGGCAVLGAMHAIATAIRPGRRVVALLAAAENSISDEAYRPDDVLRFRNGVTAEITNTDAEGRLVLADALCWACEREDPAAIIDLATLTGGVVTALGSTYAGMFCDDDRLRARVEAAAVLSGERVWRLPFHQEYRDMMKSPVADIVNSNPNRKAHAGQGAAFLSYFVDARIPWCHLDIAGVHVADKNAGPFIEGPTGWGVRLLANLVETD